MSLYQYVASNPINRVDSSGLWYIEIVGPSTPPWNIPPGIACQSYCCNSTLMTICNNAGTGCWSNCVRGCLLKDRDPVKCKYKSGGALRHVICFNYCDLKCHGGVVWCKGNCPCGAVPVP